MKQQVQEVIVAVDGTKGSIAAAQAAARLADAMDASLTLLYVFPLLPHELGGVMHLTTEDFERMRDTAAREVFDKVVPALEGEAKKGNQVTLVGDPPAEILAYLDNRQDVLAVVGRRGQSTIASLLLGSVSDKVVRYTHTPVTVVS